MTGFGGIAYPNTFNGGGTTWVAVPIPLSIPEASPMALTGLGTAVLLVLRRQR